MQTLRFYINHNDYLAITGHIKSYILVMSSRSYKIGDALVLTLKSDTPLSVPYHYRNRDTFLSLNKYICAISPLKINGRKTQYSILYFA